jgi:competence protein ComEC
MSESITYKQIPFLRLLLPFVVGIAIGLSPWNTVIPLVWLLVTSIAALLFVVSLWFVENWQYRWLTGVAVNAFLVTSGILLVSQVQSESKIAANSEASCVVRLLEPVNVRSSSVRVMANVEYIANKESRKKIDEDVLMYFSLSDSLALKLKYGNSIALKCKFNSIPTSKNPAQFNYSSYLAKKSVFRSAYISPENWIYLSSNANPIISKAFDLRENLTTLFARGGLSERNLAVATALTSGYKALLDSETQRTFSTTGAMHILAVSGLHVGVIFIVFSSILFFFDRIRNGKFYKAIALIAMLWAFAVFTGLSPSVLRATLMFSLVIVGKSLSRNSNIYNTLASSAFVLLVANPMFITEVGFQLSYLAVLSIVFFYPHIYVLIYVRNKYFDKVWALIAVSTAAQLGTLPLTLFYFNQFPNYFLITNIIAIPLATLIIYFSMLLIVFSPIQLMIKFFGWLLNAVIELLNISLGFIDTLPFSSTSGINLGILQLILLFMAVILLGIFFESKKGKVLALVLGCILITLSIKTVNYVELKDKSEIAIFSVKGKTLIGILQKGELSFLSSDSLPINPLKVYSDAISGYHRITGSPKVTHLSLVNYESNPPLHFSLQQSDAGKIVIFNNVNIYIPQGDNLKAAISQKPLIVDLLILSSMNKNRIEDVLKIVTPKRVIIDSSVSEWKADAISRQLIAYGIHCHKVSSEGAFQL